MKLLDRPIAVDHLRGAGPAVDLLRRLVDEEETVVASEVVRFELLAGVQDDELEGLESFFAAISWSAIDEDVARRPCWHGGTDEPTAGSTTSIT